MIKLKNILWAVANFFLLGALSRRRARLERELEFTLLSRLRVFRRNFLRRVAMRRINAHPVQQHLPRRVRREMARHAGNAEFRRERGLPTPMSKSHRRRAMRVAYDILAARVPAAEAAAA